MKERAGSGETPDQYGVLPQWPWKDDMKNYFVYATDDPNNGLVTNDFKTMRENVWNYEVNYGTAEDSPRISVESAKASVAARVDITYDLGYLDDRDSSIKYSGGWHPYDASSDYGGTEMYSTAEGDTCELTFEGTGVRYIGAKQKNTGLVDVYIDGEFKEQIDTYSNLGSDLKQAVIYSIEGLANGTHTIELVTAGGNADCIVVDAFEILRPEGSLAEEEAKLIINNQWYYPNLGWGNYTGKTGVLSEGLKGSATIRLANGKNFSGEDVASLTNVTIQVMENQLLKVAYDVRNGSDETEVELQWYRVPVGDPDSKAQIIEGENGEILDVSRLAANRVYCTATLKTAGSSPAPVKSNILEVGEEEYQYYDIQADSDLYQFTGTKGKDYITDINKPWTTTAYGKSVTYLLDTANEADVSFAFSGSGIRWVGAKENNQGIAEVSIDGGTPVEVDLFDPNSSTGSQVTEVLFEQIWDESAEHSIIISRTGRKNPESKGANISLDAFLVIDQEGGIASVKDVAVDSADDGSLEVSYALFNCTEEDVQYQWYSTEAYSSQGYEKDEYTPIKGAVEKTYMPSEEDAGKLLRCEVALKSAEGVRSDNAVLAGAQMVDDADDRVQYPPDSIRDTTEAEYLSKSQPYNDTITYFQNGVVTYGFDGTGIVWLSGYDQTPRSAVVQIDDGEEQIVEIAASPNGGWDFNQYEVFRVENLEPGTHRITITSGGANVYNNVDGFMVLNPGEAQSTFEANVDLSDSGAEHGLEGTETAGSMKPMSYHSGESILTEARTQYNTIKLNTEQKSGNSGKATSEVATAIQELTQAIVNFKASLIVEEVADKSMLEALVNAVDGWFNEGQYTPESWKVFEEALQRAKEVLADHTAVNEEVKRAYDELLAARDGLAYLTIPVEGITVSPENMELETGKSKKLTVTILPENATNKEVTFTSSNTEAATVDQNGSIKAVVPGKATITVTTKDKEWKAECAVTVKAAPGTPTPTDKPTPTKKPSKPGSGTGAAAGAKTGDTSPIAVLTAFMVLGAAGLSVLVIYKKRNNK